MELRIEPFTNLREANLYGTDLREANLRGTDLREANLREADLREAELRNTGTIQITGFGAYDILIQPGMLTIGCQRMMPTEWVQTKHDCSNEAVRWYWNNQSVLWMLMAQNAV